MGALAAAGVTLLAVSLFTHLILGQPVYQLSEQFGVIRALPLFVVGLAVARAVDESPLPRRLCGPLLAASVAGLAAIQILGRADFISMAVLALAIGAAGSAGVTRPSRLSRFGGRVSFPLFITHAFSLTLWFGGLHALLRHGWAVHAGWAFWGAGVGFALAVALLFDRFIDRPIQARINRLLASGRAAQGLSAPALA